MKNYIYETHIFEDPRLPFIFHKSFTAPRQNFPPNWHENVEILYCADGKGYVKCGTEVYDFSQGDIFVVNADTPHVVRRENTITYRCLIIDNAFFHTNGIPVSMLQFQRVIRDDSVSRLFEDVKDAYDRYDSVSVCAVADIRYAVLGLLRKLCTTYAITEAKSAQSASSEHVKKALTYIRKNIARPITLDAVADHVGISKFHLAREFRDFTGSTIIDTVNLIRCAEARQLIEGGMRVCQAANACGYENLSYFSRTFKKLFNRCPSAFSRPRP